MSGLFFIEKFDKVIYMKKIFISGLIFLILLILAAAGILIFNNLKQEKLKESSEDSDKKEETSQIIVNSPQISPYKGEAITFIGNDSIINQLSSAIIEKKEKYLADLAEILNKNPFDYESWMQVGIHKKFFNNYEGARQAWEYAKIIEPAALLPYLNLANLYAYYFNDLTTAEANYLTAVSLDRQNIYGSYDMVAGFYRDFGFEEKALEYYKRVLEFRPGDKAVIAEIERLQNK